MERSDAGIQYCEDWNGVIWEITQGNRGNQSRAWESSRVLAARENCGSAEVGCLTSLWPSSPSARCSFRVGFKLVALEMTSASTSSPLADSREPTNRGLWSGAKDDKKGWGSGEDYWSSSGSEKKVFEFEYVAGVPWG